MAAAHAPIRCAITDLGSLAPAYPEQRERLLSLVAGWMASCAIEDRVTFIQLREKSLDSRTLLALATEIAATLQASGSAIQLLLNGRADVAVAAGAHGVHLPGGGGALTPGQVRQIFAAAGRPAPRVSVACHTLADVRRARGNRADLLLFGPVFEKRGLRPAPGGDATADSEAASGPLLVEGTGLARLAEACRLAAPLPVLALGGVTLANTPSVLAAGAAGVAAIRMFSCP